MREREIEREERVREIEKNGKMNNEKIEVQNECEQNTMRDG